MTCYDKAAEAFGWKQRNPQPGSMRDGDWLIGYGCATARYPTHVGQAHVNIDDDYTCTAACGGGPVSFDLNEDIIRAGLNYRFWMN